MKALLVKEWIGKVRTKVDELSLRERAILFMTLMALIYLAWDALLFNPMKKGQMVVLDEIKRLQAEMATIDQTTEATVSKSTADPDVADRAERDRLQAELQALSSQITDSVNGLIAPTQMAGALEKVLSGNKRLRLVKLENIPTRTISSGVKEAIAAGVPGSEALPVTGIALQGNPAASAQQTTPPPSLPQSVLQAAPRGVFVHGLRIELEGTYPDAVDYLRSLQQLPLAFYWDSVEITMKEYPKAKVVIIVHTLSTSEGWLGV